MILEAWVSDGHWLDRSLSHIAKRDGERKVMECLV